eukprot:m.238143 g.238143  ORF g.238143 m.238143 type:complete len:128 (-) comp21617_c0_seq1:184-567(-)
MWLFHLSDPLGPTEPLHMSLIFKALSPRNSWSKDELFECAYWIRQIVAVVLGVVWGLLPMEGGLGLGLYIAASSSWVYAFYAMYHKIPLELLGVHDIEVLSQGFKEGFAAFMALWIIIYSMQGTASA